MRDATEPPSRAHRPSRAPRGATIEPMPNVGPLELAIVLIIALVIFGPKRLPELGKSLGNGLREFKNSVSGDGDDDEPPEIDNEIDDEDEEEEETVVEAASESSDEPTRQPSA
jgi:sec-independent protein translocase protein TatA